MSKKMVKDQTGFHATIEEDNFMPSADAQAEVEDWWAKHGKKVKHTKHKGGKEKNHDKQA